MTKDYAKKQAFKSARVREVSHDSNTISLPSWVWMLFGLLMGGATSGFFFWKLVYSNNASTVPPAPTIIVNSKEENKPKITDAIATLKKIEQNEKTNQQAEEEPRFDFYTLLPNLSVDVPDVATPQQVEQAEVISPQQPTPEAFILQVGSFREEYQAEELKIRLILQGQDAKVQTVKINPNDIWYRVYIGPYALKADALETQQKLNSLESADSLILKIRV